MFLYNVDRVFQCTSSAIRLSSKIINRRLDGEMHEIATPQGMTDSQFINTLQEAINEYQNNCPYILVDENCAAWVNSMLARVGIPKSEREQLGEFFGIDWGEEDLIPDQYFKKE